MKGSIRFDNEINVEVAVDPSQDEGAKLLSAVNLVDGQELSPGGGGVSGLVTYTEDVGIDKTYNELMAMLTSEVVPYFIYGGNLFALCYIMYNSDEHRYGTDFNEVLTASILSFSSNDGDTPMFLD